MAPINMANSKNVNNVVSTNSNGDEVPNTKSFMSRKFSQENLDSFAGDTIARFRAWFAIKLGIAYSCQVFEEGNADVAQLVEHHLAKVRVASSNLVIRSDGRKAL